MSRKAILQLSIVVLTLTRTSLANTSCETTENSDPPSWVNGGTIIVLLLSILLSFCGLGIVCEEYFVPALNRLCDEWSIPDDVAGATIMAMGNSAPEIFTTFISIFYTKSSLGVGTAIGSALFNHLMICGCSVIYAPNLVLHLNYKLLMRECGFYALSLMLVVWAIKGSFVGAVLELGATSEDCLSVHWMQSLFLCIVYIVYVLTCTYGGISSSHDNDWSAIDNTLRYSFSSTDSAGITLTPLLQANEITDYEEDEPLESSPEHALYGSASCYMYKQSRFYSRIRVVSHLMWQRRYFTCDDTGLHYGTSPSHQHKYIDIFHATSVTYENYTITLTLPQRKYRFKGTDEMQLLEMFRLLKNKVDSYTSLSRAELNEAIAEARRLREREELDDTTTILTFPTGSGSKILHVLLYPLKFVIYMSFPADDMPRIIASISIIWLGALSLCMTVASEIAAKYFGISAGVLGLTLGAAGTSFPNLLSSVLVAKQGCGDMAVANAFGSNIFCILVGLGLPWLLVSIQNHGEPYDQLRDDGIVVSVVLLLVLLVLFVLILYMSQFVLQRWMGIAMVGLYAAYSGYAIWMDRQIT